MRQLTGDARRATHQLAELACWVEWRCPELWLQAGRTIAARLPVRPSWPTQRGGQLVEALRLAGVLDPEGAAEAMRPFARLEAARAAYLRNAAGFGIRSPFTLHSARKPLDQLGASDEQESRFGSLRARRARFLAKGRRGSTRERHGQDAGL